MDPLALNVAVCKYGAPLKDLDVAVNCSIESIFTETPKLVDPIPLSIVGIGPYSISVLLSIGVVKSLDPLAIDIELDIW